MKGEQLQLAPFAPPWSVRWDQFLRPQCDADIILDTPGLLVHRVRTVDEAAVECRFTHSS